MKNKLYYKLEYTEERLKQLEELGLTEILPITLFLGPNIIFEAFEPIFEEAETESLNMMPFKCHLELKKKENFKLTEKPEVNP